MKKISLIGKRVLSAVLSATMVISMMPTATGRAADSGVTVYAAAYQNGTDAATDTSLPEQVEVGGETKAVTWNLTGTEFPTAYERVSVTGTTADGSSVTAQVEVLPEKENQVIYFVDAARESGGSKAFDAVKSLAGGTLKNEAPDQAYDKTSGWGRTNGSFYAKGADSVSGTDKYQTGYYGENNKANSLDYQYRLEAGTYIVTAGFYEWWSGPRKMKMTVSGEQVDSVSTEEYSVSSSSRKAVRSLRFTVKEESAVNMSVALSSGTEAPVISWFAVEKVSERTLAKEALQNLVTEMEKVDGTDYLEESWNAFTAALAEAQEMLANEGAASDELKRAAQNLETAHGNLEKLEGTESNLLIYAAAYQNAAALSQTSLPEAVTIGETEKNVTWNLKSSAFAVPYDTVNVSGITANSEIVRAKVEVLPKAENALVYFVDASRDTGKESKAFDAVSAFTGSTLKNTVADQVYTEESGWGRTGENFSLKSESNIDVTDKGQSGWYSNKNNEALTYQYRLEAGVYTVTAGFREWWSTSRRNMKIKISGEQTGEALSEEIAFSSQGEYQTKALTFTVKADSLVKMEIVNTTGGEAPVISWFAVEKEALQTAKAELQKYISALPEVKEDQYTQESYQTFAEALQAAQDVLDNTEADKKAVEDADAALRQAYGNLKEPEGQKADRTELQAVVDQYKNTDTTKYTSDSAEAFEKALQTAQSILADDAATQLQVDEAKAALENAYNALKTPEIQESNVTVYAAAYQNAADVSDTSLPATVQVNGETKKVDWTIRSSKFSVPYQTAEAEGITENYYRVHAKVEVLPAKANDLVYFIDASRDSGNVSEAYNGVKALRGDKLKNAVADQTYTEASGWGRTSGSFTARGTGSADVTDKYQTGWYGNNGDVNSLNYQYTLEAGTYTVTAGFCEWWSGPRTMKMSVGGAETDSVETAEFSVSSSSSRTVKSLTFTVKKDSVVTLSVANKSGSDAPVISWFAVAKGTVEVPNTGVETDIVVKGRDVEQAAKNVNGLTYKGYGLLSGNSTSDLLMDYKQESPEAYQELLQVLFGGEHPLITHVKMEMGNDGNNSTGADSCTMRFENEEADVTRSPGFQLAADAKKINPNVKVSFLRWEMPAWVQKVWDSEDEHATKGYEAMYKWYRETVFDAYEKYGYVVDYIDPDKNETTKPDTGFIKWFRSQVKNETEFPSYMDATAQEAYHNIKIIASDENTSLNIVPGMRSDKELYDAVDAIGFHYSTGTASSTADYRKMADEDDKEVWYSEGCATFSYTEYQENKNTDYGAGTIGGYQSPLALADNFISSFIYSRKTHYIFQPAVGSFYEGAQYDHKEIISAREPWAGYIHYDPMIYMLQHFTKFSKAGWENQDNTAGIWRVIANASGNTSGNRGDLGHLTNENGNPSYLTLAAPDKSAFSIVMVNNSEKTLPYTISAEGMNIEAGAPMEIWETKTDSYLQYKGEAKYEDGYYTVEVAPFSMVTVTTLDCNGKEEYTERLPEEKEKTVLDTDASGKTHKTDDDILYADDFGYSSYPGDYLEKRGNEPRYAVDFTGAFAVEDGKLKQLLTQSVGQWNPNEPNTVIGDFRWMNYKASVDVTVAGSSYAGLNIRQQTGMGFEGSGYSLRITKDGAWTLKKRGTVLKSGTVTANAAGTYHLALEGKDGLITAWVDDVCVASYSDPEPEYFGRVRLGCGWAETVFDNLKVEKVADYEPYALSLIDNAADDVKYEGAWTIIAGAGGSNNDWYRSTSTTTEAGASFGFTMNGGGFALIGENNGSAVLDVAVDGKKVAEDVATQSSQKHCAAYLQYGLSDGSHEVTVTVKSGTFVLDAIDILPYSEDDRIVETETVYTAAYTNGELNLPKTVPCTRRSGKTEEAEVNWNTGELTVTDYETLTISGTTVGESVPVTAYVEVVPEDLVYFVSGGTGTGYLDHKTQAAVSRPWEAVKELVKDLKNNSSDAAYTAESGWGYADDDTMSSTIDGGDRPESHVSTDKYLVGLRDKTKGASPMVYSFTLDAGSYVLTAGYHEFWGSRERDMQPSVVWTDADGTRHEVKGDVIQLRGRNLKRDISFSLTEAATVQYQLAYVSGEAAMFSWLAVRKVEETGEEIQAAKDALTETIQSIPEVDASQYTETSYQAFADAMNKANEILKNPAASKVQVENAQKLLLEAYQKLQTVEKPEPEPEEPDKAALVTALGKYKDVSASGYTKESYQAFAEALKKAREIYADSEATEEQITGAIAALEDAYQGLKKKEEKPSEEKPTETEPGTKVPQPADEKTVLGTPVIASLKSTAGKSGSAVTITVSKVANADSYDVYRNVGGKVLLIGMTKTGVIRDQKPASGKKASYYAVAKSENAKFMESAAGASKSITLPRDTKKVRAKKSGKMIKVTFRKVKGAKGYLVYRSEKKNGTWKKLTKKPVKKLYYLDKKAKKKKTYYYKVVVCGKNKTYSAGKVSGKIKNR